MIPDSIITEKYAVTDAVGEVSIQVDLFTHPGSGEHKITVKGRVSVFDQDICWSNLLNLIFIGISNARKNPACLLDNGHISCSRNTFTSLSRLYKYGSN